MIRVAVSLLNHLGPGPRRHIGGYVALALVVMVLDLLLMLGVLGFARLLMRVALLEHGSDWFVAWIGPWLRSQWRIVVATAGLLGISLLKTLMQGYMVFLRNKILVPLIQGAVRNLFIQQLATPFQSLSERNLGEVTALLIEDLRQSIQNVLIPCLDLVPDAFVVVSLLGLLLWMDPAISVALGLTFAVSAGTQVLSTRKLQRRMRHAAREIVPGILSVTNQALSSVREVKVMHRELGFRQRMRHVARKYAQAIGREGIARAIPRLWTENFLFLCLFMFAVVVVLIERQEQDIVPSLALFCAAGWRLLPLSSRILHAVSQMRPHLPSARDLVSRWNAEAAHIKPPAPDALASRRAVFTESIRLQALDCGYRTGSPAVIHLNAEIRRGDTVAIAGPSGSGKTTLIDTLLGLLDPLGGRIEIDGHPLADIRLHWQRLIGYVPQDPYVANETLRNNVAWGLPNSQVSDERINEVLALTGMTEFVHHLPLGLDTRLGERGMRLSGGQRQRLCIARALLANPQVLVLDEATSQLDLAAESTLLKAIRTLSPDLTLILVAHRLETLAKCDAVIDLCAYLPVNVSSNHPGLRGNLI
ncbi:putative ABC transporter ATP-binding protein [Gammaproteobacteria bacterium]